MRYGNRTHRKNTLAQKKHNARLFKLGVVVLTVVLLVVGISYATHAEKFHIKEVVISGNSITSSSEIKKVVINDLAGLYFRLFIRKNAFIYPKQKIQDDIVNNFQRVESVKLSIEGFEKIKIEITERAPNALWCGQEHTDDRECYFLDSDGLIYSRAPDFSGNVFFRVYGKIGGSNPIGRFFLSMSDYRALKFFKTSMEQFGLIPVSLNKLGDDDLEITLDDGAKVIYNSEQDVVNLSDDLISILDDPEFKTNLEKGSSLDYIDLRFGNKVYFKFK